MTPAEYERALYDRRIADGERKVAVWVEAKALETLQCVAKKERRSLRAQLAIILEDWVKYHVEDIANP